MKSEKVEYNELIAIRSPPGDRWRLVDDQEEKIHEGLTNALEAYFHKSKFKGSYKLDPLDGKLYSINSQEVEVEEVIEEPKEYGIYGEVNWKQGV
tara:strand:+ start:2979 stop:3263 length:285 start_codon:yes stop_codon:yes gene_type:complete